MSPERFDHFSGLVGLDRRNLRQEVVRPPASSSLVPTCLGLFGYTSFRFRLLLLRLRHLANLNTILAARNFVASRALRVIHN